MSLLSYTIQHAPGATDHDKDIAHQFDRLAHSQDPGLTHRMAGYLQKSARLVTAIDALNPHAKNLVVRHLETHILGAVRKAVAEGDAHPALAAIKREGHLVAKAIGVDLSDDDDSGAP